MIHTRVNQPAIIIQGEIHSSKNSRRIMRSKSGAPFIAKSERAKEDEGTFSIQFYNQRETWEKMIAGHEFPITLVFSFRRATKRKFDYVNIAQGVLDAMVRAEYLPDDDANHVIPAFLPYVVDRDNPGCELRIGVDTVKKKMEKGSWRKAERKVSRKAKPEPKKEIIEMTKSNMVDSDVLEVLKSAWCEGLKLYLPPTQMERKLYERTNEVLTRLGGKWKGGKTRAHVFEDDPAPLLAEVLSTGIMPLDNPLDFYRTPADVIDRMIEVAGDMSHAVVLEPSAGDGAIVEKVIEKYPTATIYVAEIDDKRAMKLREKFGAKIKTIFTDFMECEPTRPDYVLMNPPFTSQDDKLTYIAHIQKAYALLLDGGRLVAIAPAGLKWRSDKRTTALRDFIEAHGTIEDLPTGAFGESGTLVSTVLVTMLK